MFIQIGYHSVLYLKHVENIMACIVLTLINPMQFSFSSDYDYWISLPGTFHNFLWSVYSKRCTKYESYPSCAQNEANYNCKNEKNRHRNSILHLSRVLRCSNKSALLRYNGPNHQIHRSGYTRKCWVILPKICRF